METEPIAIIGMSCRFPGCESIEEYWQLLCMGKDAISEVPATRWDIAAFYDRDTATPNTMNTKWGGFLAHPELFDAAFFGIAPREAIHVDPQQRLLLEVSWEALERAAMPADRLAQEVVGSFIGVASFDYYERIAEDITRIGSYTMTGNAYSIVANRLSYVFDFRGPSIAVDTACSSSLVAVHLACQSLRLGESTVALAGGTHIMLSPWVSVAASKGEFMAPDGRCKTFDARADGYVRGEGVGVVVLKTLKRAMADGDPICALIHGSAVNQNGRSNGLTAPNPQAQQTLLRAAYREARINPRSVGYIEAHGTGTRLGDPMEMQSLAAVLAEGRGPHEKCFVGSAKTNFGHLEAAAGIAGLIKAALTVQHGLVPPNLHFEQPNPLIDFDRMPLTVPRSLEPWPMSGNRFAGVSSFGFGGTNSHVVVGAGPEQSTVDGVRKISDHLLVLSAKTEPALRALAKRYADVLIESSLALSDICYTASVGRTHFLHRLAIVGRDQASIAEALVAVASDSKVRECGIARLRRRRPPKVAFVFTGQGSQYPGMARQLFETNDGFRETIERCDEILQPLLPYRLIDVLYREHANGNILAETLYTQPVLFSIEAALVDLLRQWGIEPAVVMGHSLGEFSAGYAAGVFDMEDGLRLVAERARLMQQITPAGAMLAVFANETVVAPYIAEHAGSISIAAINGSDAVVISGVSEAIDAVTAKLADASIESQRLLTSHGFHSPLMTSVAAEFRKAPQFARIRPPTIPFISNVTGSRLGTEVGTPNYWCRHVVEPVRFANGALAMLEDGVDAIVEVGPKPTLSAMMRSLVPKNILILPTLRGDGNDRNSLLKVAATLYLEGLPIRWEEVHCDKTCRKVILPTYQFERQRFWILDQPIVRKNATGAPTSTDALHPLLQSAHGRRPTDNLLYGLDWVAAELPDSTTPRGPKGGVIILAGDDQFSELVIRALDNSERRAVLVVRGVECSKMADGTFTVDPTRPESFARLFELVEGQIGPLECIVNLWSIAEPLIPAESDTARAWQAIETGCHPLLGLVKAVADHKPSISSLTLVTVGSQAVHSTREVVAPHSAPVWGLGRTIGLEFPEVRTRLVDLDGTSQRNATLLAQELTLGVGEAEIAYREGQRFVSRLVRQKPDPEETGRLGRSDSIHSDGCYLVTGGLGALGLEIAEWLVNEGASDLLLIGRSIPSVAASLRIDDLRKRGTRVIVASADIADLQQAKSAVEQAPSPVRGIIHAAGVLDDGVILQQTWERFCKVVRPKTLGFLNLHNLTLECKLDFFVGYSSVASLFGSAGQMNYAAANAFLDAMAQWRHASGLPALSINWGPFAEVGMAATQVDQHRDKVRQRGVFPVAPEVSFRLLKDLVPRDEPRAAVLDIDWPLFFAASEAIGPIPAVFDVVRQEVGEVAIAAGNAREGLLKQLQNQDSAESYAIVQDYIKRTLGSILQVDEGGLDVDQSLTQYGLDSLMSVEFKNAIKRELGVDLSVVKLLRGMSVCEVCSFLCEQITAVEEGIAVVQGAAIASAINKEEIVEGEI